MSKESISQLWRWTGVLPSAAILAAGRWIFIKSVGEDVIWVLAQGLGVFLMVMGIGGLGLWSIHVTWRVWNRKELFFSNHATLASDALHLLSEQSADEPMNDHALAKIQELCHVLDTLDVPHFTASRKHTKFWKWHLPRLVGAMRGRKLEAARNLYDPRKGINLDG